MNGTGRAATTGSPRVLVVGGGLAGMAAALDCAGAGATVTLLEHRRRLGGLTWSFRHGNHWIDNGQHVFLRCCHEYLAFLDRIGAAADVHLPARLDVPVVAPASGPSGPPLVGRLRRSDLPAPFHLLGALARYPHLSVVDRLRLSRAVVGLRRMRLDDPALDRQTFHTWLRRHGQSPDAVVALWDLITVPTVNLPAAEASLAMGAMVFKTGLLTDPGAADIGWSRVPLGQLHGERGAAALRRAGVEVRLGARVEAVREGDLRRQAPFLVAVGGQQEELDADAVIMAVPHEAAGTLLPPGSVAHQHRLAELGRSAIVDVHLVFDRPVTRWPLMAGVRSPIQWVFDRTVSSGLGSSGPGASGLGSSGLGSSGGSSSDRRPPAPGRDRHQYLAVSLSGADELLPRSPAELVPWVTAEVARLLPRVGEARLLDSTVTKERAATFRAVPGTARLRSGPRTSRPGLAVAGAWTDTGWPATMEGAVRSGRAAARAILVAFPALSATTRPPVSQTTQEVA
jgi:squalene-associated FAD-dependent desaturase